jgi:phosphomannomutase
MALTLEMLAHEGKTVSAVRAEMPRYYMVKDKVRLQGAGVAPVLRQIRHKHQHERINLIDGVYVEVDDGWFHVRASNTEPVLRVCAEAATEESARGMVSAVKAEIAALL